MEPYGLRRVVQATNREVENMQHGTTQEAVIDILENAIAVLRRERAIHGWKVDDVIVNLESASILVQETLQNRSQGPVGKIDEDRDRHNIPHHKSGGIIDLPVWDASCAECRRTLRCPTCGDRPEECHYSRVTLPRDVTLGFES